MKALGEDATRKSASKEVESFVSEQDFKTLYLMLQEWKKKPLDERLAIVDVLVERLSSRRKTPIKNTYGGLLIPSRKDMDFRGDGLVLEQDALIEGGRSAWAIQTLLRVWTIFPSITETISNDELKLAVHQINNVIRAYKNGIEDYKMFLKDSEKQ
jgi:hypothetical protein